MKGLISNYESTVDLTGVDVYCTCGKIMEVVSGTTWQVISRCEECAMQVEYKRDSYNDRWDIGQVVEVDNGAKGKSGIDESVLESLIMKLDAIAEHLGVELVKIPERFDCKEEEDAQKTD